MNNDDWIKTLDKVPSEHRATFDAMRGHYDDVHLGELHAFLTMLSRIEEKQDAAALDRGQVTAFLGRLDTALEAASVGQAALAEQFHDFAAGVSQWQTEVDKWRAGMDTWRARTDGAISDFLVSRNTSIQERQVLRRDLEESKEDRRALHSSLNELIRAIADLNAQIAAIRSLELTPENQQELTDLLMGLRDQVGAIDVRVRRLESGG